MVNWTAFLHYPPHPGMESPAVGCLDALPGGKALCHLPLCTTNNAAIVCEGWEACWKAGPVATH